MVNFKALALATTLALGGIVGGMAPAQAGTCWYDTNTSQTVRGEYCRTDRRVNANGHVVWDVTQNDGQVVTLVFWDDSVVEVIGVVARPYQATYYTDRDGDYRIQIGRGEMAIRL